MGQDEYTLSDEEFLAQMEDGVLDLVENINDKSFHDKRRLNLSARHWSRIRPAIVGVFVGAISATGVGVFVGTISAGVLRVWGDCVQSGRLQ